ncbi:MAG: hypothetical protein Q9220_003420 [cf. Caloplaca sp. 1 TL-2023]
MLHRVISTNLQEHNAHGDIAKPLRRPSITNLRARTSPLKFFSSSNTPKQESRNDSHQDWEKEYLNDLRTNRPARPIGARPAPTRAEALVNDATLRSSSAMSFRPSLPMRQTSPSRVEEQERCSSALSYPRKTRDASWTSRTSSGAYQERGHRLVEKEEARTLREALETVDQQEEVRLHTAAQDEASGLVWKHQNPEAFHRHSDITYTSAHRIKGTNHTRSQSERLPQAEVNEPIIPMDRRTNSRSDEEAEYNGACNMSPTHGQDHDWMAPKSWPMQSRSGQDSTSTEVHSHPKVDPETHTGRPGVGHASWDSPSKKAYMNLTFSLPQVKTLGRRRSSGSKLRTPSGSLFRNPDDKIYEEPEGIKQEEQFPCLPQDTKYVPLKSTTRNPIVNVQPVSGSLPRSVTEPLGKRGKVSCTEIHRNPPSQSRNPSYRHNEDFSKPNEPDATEPRGEIEIRGEDIRTATSMRLRDRSPKLPSPTVTSQRKDRPIVSFDKDWTPARADVQSQNDSLLSSGAQGHGAHGATRPNTLAKSITSAPTIPTISVVEPPAIQVDAPSPPPSTHIATVPSISVSAIDNSTCPPADTSKSSRPLPAPSRKTNAKPFGRPLPHHSATAPSAWPSTQNLTRLATTALLASELVLRESRFPMKTAEAVKKMVTKAYASTATWIFTRNSAPGAEAARLPSKER